MNIDKINNTKKEIIKNFNPVEMEAYIKSLISNLYDSFINRDLNKALASKELIEEASSIYVNDGYSNTFTKELEFRLTKANECLINTLEEKHKVECFLSEEVVKNLLTNQIETLTYSNGILNILIAGYEREPSENLLITLKQVHELIKMELTLTKCLLENNYLVGLEDHTDKINIIRDSYNRYEKLAARINGF